MSPDSEVAVGERCPACGEELTTEDARFCEACGEPLQATESLPPPGAEAEGDADDLDEGCAACGAEIGDDGYCTGCGLRSIEEIAVDDRGPVASATHRGRRHRRNEDSVALAATAEGWPVVVVSDGVSASPNPHRASAAAVTAAADQLAGKPFEGTDDLVAAVSAAHDAASAIPGSGDPDWVEDGSHPACTIVVAVATGDAVHTANVGDARAFLLEGRDGTWAAAQLTTDDSLAAQAVSQGIEPTAALALPGGHALTAWLGADAPDPAVHLRSYDAKPGNVLVVCSDGLWNYAPTDVSLGALMSTKLGDGARHAAACEELVAWAIEQGGADNITVALATVAGPPGEAPNEQQEEEE